MSEPIPAAAFANRVAVAACDKPTGLDIMLVNDDS